MMTPSLSRSLGLLDGVPLAGAPLAVTSSRLPFHLFLCHLLCHLLPFHLPIPCIVAQLVVFACPPVASTLRAGALYRPACWLCIRAVRGRGAQRHTRPWWAWRRGRRQGRKGRKGREGWTWSRFPRTDENLWLSVWGFPSGEYDVRDTIPTVRGGNVVV